MYNSPWSFAIAAGFGVATVQMFVRGKWQKRAGWLFAILTTAFVALGVHGVLSTPKVVVTLSEKSRRALGEPFPVEKLSYPWVYQGLYENGWVIWADGRFFELGLNKQYWHSFADPFPTNDPQWFTEATLRKHFPTCGDRLPIGGLAKAMLGPERQYYAWLGCLQSSNASSLTDRTVVQRFENGYVIEGVLDPPQSAYRKRFILTNDAGWESEAMDSSGRWFPNTLH